MLHWCCDEATSYQVDVLLKNEHELGNHEELANLINQLMTVNSAMTTVLIKYKGNLIILNNSCPTFEKQ
ncbi:hypothetical protein PR048_013337 [Dryococelus australis]|uniref:Uncharacterized protein n=1 Tax=Dryococelus australis TaxID=614101 RepID=A0ABQ9HSB1_9NEOP|nr:hypothetical protein PR048_013337 [Dryococelus australis]